MSTCVLPPALLELAMIRAFPTHTSRLASRMPKGIRCRLMHQAALATASPPAPYSFLQGATIPRSPQGAVTELDRRIKALGAAAAAEVRLLCLFRFSN